MTFFLIFSALVLLIYSVIVLFAVLKIKVPIKTNQIPGILHGFTYTIIIPFRNEIENLTHILSDLKQLNFVKDRFEVIFIDDNSSDGSFEFLENSELPKNFKLLRALKDGKKQAIAQAISSASGSYIYTIDADCRLHPDLLRKVDDMVMVKKPGLLIQPVISYHGNSLLSRFQYYDYLSLMGINKAVVDFNGQPALASAANLIFNKETFETLKPFNDNLNISSGDDMFLLRSFLKEDHQSVFLNYTPENLVITNPEKSWPHLIKQRIRWTGKMRRFSSSISFFLGMLSMVVQIVFISLFVLGLSYQVNYILFFLCFWLFKSLLDYLFFKKTALLLGQKASWFEVLILEPLYMIFVPVVILLSLFVHPKWKGRKISH